MAGEETAKVATLKEQVWAVADQILATGRYPNRDDICKALEKSPHTIGSYFYQWKKVNPRSSVVKQQPSEIDRTRLPILKLPETREVVNHAISDEDFQYSAAKDGGGGTLLQKNLGFYSPRFAGKSRRSFS